MAENIELPDNAASLIAAFLVGARGVTKLNPWEEVADRLVEHMRVSWRPVPAEAGDSTADETPAQVEFDFRGKTLVGKAMPRREGENAPSWTTVDTGGPLGIFLVPNCDLRPASSAQPDSAADETAEEASKRGQAILQEEVHGHRHDGNGIAEACMECREWVEDMVHALAFCGLVITPPAARPASSVRDTAETADGAA